jgi:BASS family bile acid:Na+ symporter
MGSEMSFAGLTLLLLSTSIKLIVLSLGLQTTPQDATLLFRRSRWLLRSMLAMAVVMPVFAGVLVYALNLPPAVEITLVVLSVSPVPPILPKRQVKAGGRHSYALGLLVAAAVMSILFVPAAVELFARVFDRPFQMSPVSIARIVITTVIGPLAVGMAIRLVWPRFADRFAEPLSRTASLLLIAAVVPVLFVQRSALVSMIGNGTLLAMAVFALVGLGTGFVLGGPERTDRTVLALSTATRHPGVAMAIASTNFPDQKLILPAILLYFVVSILVSTVFLAWLPRKKDDTSQKGESQLPAA